MDQRSRSTRCRVPLGDVTNTNTIGVPGGEEPNIQDSKERRRQKDRERYAAMPQDKKDELNRRRRERRKQKNVYASGIEEGGNSEWRHMEHVDTETTDGCVLMEEYKNNDQLHMEHVETETTDGCVPMEEDENNDWLHRGNLDQYNETEHLVQDTPGAGDETSDVDDQTIISPGERCRRRDRAHFATMSPGQREALNKRKRDARAAKRLFKTPQEKETTRQSKLNYKKRIKEQRANNLHPDSITMANPQFKPEVIFPPGDKPPFMLSEHMEIPDFGGTPVYVEAIVPKPPHQVETPEAFLSNTIHMSHLTPGLRNPRRNLRNQEFEATIVRNTKGTTCENDNFASQPTQSCVVENGVTQTYPSGSHPEATSNAFGAGTSRPTPRNERCTQTQPTVVDDPDSMPPRGVHKDICEDADDNIVFKEDEEEDEGYLFAGQEDDDDVNVEIDIAMDDEDIDEHDVPDPFGLVYANVKDETHMLKPVDNCEFCNAKKFESEPKGFCCRSGDIHLSTADTPPDELMRLWTASDTDAKHFRDHIRYFNGQFSFTSLYCKLDSATTDTRKCPIYTFRAHGAIYHNAKNFSKEEKYEAAHLELYFYDDDPDLDYRLSKCREKTE